MLFAKRRVLLAGRNLTPSNQSYRQTVQKASAAGGEPHANCERLVNRTGRNVISRHDFAKTFIWDQVGATAFVE